MREKGWRQKRNDWLQKRNASKCRKIEEGYHGFNIIHYHDLWYGLAQEEGAFDIAKLFRRCVAGDSVAAVKMQIRRQRLKDICAGLLHPVREIARMVGTRR